MKKLSGGRIAFIGIVMSLVFGVQWYVGVDPLIRGIGELIYGLKHGNEVVAANQIDGQALVKVLYGRKVDDLRKEFIRELMKLENPSYEILPAYVDDNKAGTLPRVDKVSYGCLAYKVSTVKAHYQLVYGKLITASEAVQVALDCDQAMELANKAIFEHQGQLWHWSAATEKMGTEVELIRKLMQ